MLPVDLLPIFTPQEAEALVCGQPAIDISLLKRVAEYVLLRMAFSTPDDVASLYTATTMPRMFFFSYSSVLACGG